MGSNNYPGQVRQKNELCSERKKHSNSNKEKLKKMSELSSYEVTKVSMTALALADATTWPVTYYLTYKILSGRMPNLFPRLKAATKFTQIVNGQVLRLQNSKNKSLQIVSPYLLNNSYGRGGLASLITLTSPLNRIFILFHAILVYPIYCYLIKSNYCRSFLGIEPKF